ncbi:MAG: AAA family ATPase [Prevotella sp.]
MATTYPIGIQTFEKIIENKMAYVDKTALVFELANGTKSNFINRPRRFGKSLLVTTLQAYFEGRKELFKGLAIDKMEKNWVKYPVLHLDLSRYKYYDLSSLMSTLNLILEEYEELYGINKDAGDKPGNRLDRIIKAAYTQTGRQVVVLVDEYDAPMLDSNNKPELQQEIRDVMRGFFSPLKARESMLRFVFLTGITKFSQLSIFSELNNIKNYSLDDEFATICGITQDEMVSNFQEGIEDLAKANNLTFDEAVTRLKEQYDGYHFSVNCPNIYNPYSLLNALYDKKFDSYWFSTGTPTFLLELLSRKNILIPELEGITASRQRFDAPTEKINDPVPVLYQSGYITIKDYQNGMYMLGFPNEEVRQGFSESMLHYISPDYQGEQDSFAWNFGKAMRADNIDAAMEALKVYLAGFPYDIHRNSEAIYQAILYSIFNTLNFTIRAEVKTATGRLDLVVPTNTSIFVMELKYDKSPEVALEQIESKQYALPYMKDRRMVYEVGINFSSKEKTVVDWKYKKVKNSNE